MNSTLNRSLILADLTPEEFDRFHAAGIGYTGSTGRSSRPEDYPGLGRYIASVESEFDRAVDALSWHRMVIENSENQLIVRRFERSTPDAPAAIFEPPSVSEAALDGWWESLDIEIKSELFNRFFEPCDEAPEEDAHAD